MLITKVITKDGRGPKDFRTIFDCNYRHREISGATLPRRGIVPLKPFAPHSSQQPIHADVLAGIT